MGVQGIHLRNELDFWNVHKIMNTLGLLQSEWRSKGFTLYLQETQSIVKAEGLHVNFARDQNYSWFHNQTKNWIYC